MTGRVRSLLWILVGCLAAPLMALGDSPTARAVLAELQASPHLLASADSVTEVADYEVGLGTLKKVRGVWGFKDSERLSGTLERYTWQVTDGFTAVEVLDDIEASLSQDDSVVALFSCDGRACGSSAQWASRVFGQRLLYGRVDQQRYRVFALGPDSDERLILYAASRSADRQYLHFELLLGDGEVAQP